MSDTILRVVEPGPSTTVQDAGRFGYQRFGVSASGAVDLRSLAIANRLVGNPPEAAALEMTMAGGACEVVADGLSVALCGADMPLAIDGTPAASNRTHWLRRGARLDIGMARAGLRAYLAVGGGIGVPPVLGSRATHLRSGLGGVEGRALRAGDLLSGEPLASPPPLLRLKHDRRPYFGGMVRIVAGPQADAFDPRALVILRDGRFRLSSQIDRMAARLDGPVLPFVDGFNIVSDGVVAGSIQVPGHGHPLVLLADCQTTGGYPKIATTITPDLARIGQRRPNERVRFQFVSADEAEEIYLEWAQGLAGMDDWLERVA
jgi:biotin-dependent carboxylase-like uncharacterized protein